MEHVWIGLGSNLSNPQKQADRAISDLTRIPMTKVVACSSRYCSQPLGNQRQPNFLNMIIVLETNLCPNLLLGYMQYIEQQQGRVRNFLKWEARTLDLDIILFGKYVINNSELVIPHYDMFNREFVIYPLMELDPKFVFPDNKSIKDVINTIPKNSLRLWR